MNAVNPALTSAAARAAAIAASGFTTASVEARVKSRWAGDTDFYADAVKELRTDHPARHYKSFEELQAAASDGTESTPEKSRSFWHRVTSPPVLWGVGGLAFISAAALLPAPALLVGAGTMAAVGLQIGATKAIAAVKLHLAKKTEENLKIQKETARQKELKDLIDFDGNEDQQILALDKLTSMNHPLLREAAELAVNIAVNEIKDNLGISAMKALGDQVSSDVLEKLIVATRDDWYPKRVAAVAALTGRKEKNVIDALERATRDGTSDVRNAALKALGEN